MYSSYPVNTYFSLEDIREAISDFIKYHKITMMQYVNVMKTLPEIEGKRLQLEIVCDHLDRSVGFSVPYQQLPKDGCLA